RASGAPCVSSALSAHDVYVSPSSSFFLHDTASPEIYTLSLHDALPISSGRIRLLGLSPSERSLPSSVSSKCGLASFFCPSSQCRSEEHTSELQSRFDLVCRLLLEKKNNERRPRRLCGEYGSGLGAWGRM